MVKLEEEGREYISGVMQNAGNRCRDLKKPSFDREARKATRTTDGETEDRKKKNSKKDIYSIVKF